MLTSLKVLTPGVVTPPFPIGDGNPETDLIQILDVSGLGPVAGTVNTAQYGSVSGEFYQGTVIGKRNIVLTIRLNPDWSQNTIESLRAILYSYFLPGTQVKLRFSSTHLPDVDIIGYPESCDPVIFASEPLMSVSIICPQPDFVASSETSLQGVTTDLTDPSYVEIDYAGKIPAGFILDVADIGPNLNGELRLTTLKPATQILTVEALVNATNALQISTVQGNKYARQLDPDGNPTNILGKVSVGSNWITLQEGINQLQVMSETPGQNWILHYNERYGGL